MPGGWSRIMGKALQQIWAKESSPGMNYETPGPQQSPVRRFDANKYRVFKRGRGTEGQWGPIKRNFERILKRGRRTEGLWHPAVRWWWGRDPQTTQYMV